MPFKKPILPLAFIVLLGVSLVYAIAYEVKPENLAQTFPTSGSDFQPRACALRQDRYAILPINSVIPGFLIVWAWYAVKQPDGSYVGSYVQALVTITGPESQNGTTTTDPWNPLVFTVPPGEYSVVGTYDSAPQQNATVDCWPEYGGSVFLDFGGPPPPLTFGVVVAGVTSSKSVVGQGYSLNISVTAVDLGTPETLNVTVYANTTYVTFQNVTVSSGTSTTLALTWDTNDFTYGNYTISAYAWPVPNETNSASSHRTGGTVYVGIPGDLNGDGTVDIYDAILLAGAFNSQPGMTNWNANADINGDGIVDIYDAIILAGNFNQHYP